MNVYQINNERVSTRNRIKFSQIQSMKVPVPFEISLVIHPMLNSNASTFLPYACYPNFSMLKVWNTISSGGHNFNVMRN